MSAQPNDSETVGRLLPLARAAIASHLGITHAAGENAPSLRERGASFVTLNLHDKLRGCAGSLQAHSTLREDVQANAIAAAFKDPRFKPLTVDEYQHIQIEVSLLSPLRALHCTDEAAALAQLQPQVHGVIFQYGHHRSTYLPHMWASFADPAMFLATLRQKAGLPSNFWDPAVEIHTYTVTQLSESPRA